MIQLDQLKQSEASFFSFFELSVPSEKHTIHDHRGCYWSAKEDRHYVHVKVALHNGPNPIYINYAINRHRREKGDYLERDNFSLFRSTYSISNVNYSDFYVFSSGDFIEDYDSFESWHSNQVTKSSED